MPATIVAVDEVPTTPKAVIEVRVSSDAITTQETPKVETNTQKTITQTVKKQVQTQNTEQKTVSQNVRIINLDEPDPYYSQDIDAIHNSLSEEEKLAANQEFRDLLADLGM